MKKKYLFLAGFAAMVLAACSDDVTTDTPTPTPEPEVNENVVPLEIFDGASQQGRLTLSAGTRAAEKWTRLKEVAQIAPPEYHKDWNWSATAISLDGDKRAFVSWHSNYQASDPATAWGGAVDVLSITSSDIAAFQASAVNTEMKFNNVMFTDNYIFLSATSYKIGAAIGRVDKSKLQSGTGERDVEMERIGFPGSSVNAIATTTNGDLIAVSGYNGTYGVFAEDAEAKPWDYENAEENTDITLNTKFPMAEKFGGKYVVADESGATYVLRNNNDVAKIIKTADGEELVLDVPLESTEKLAEDYSVDENGNVDWGLVPDSESKYYGKHVLAVNGGYAYVGAGRNGLRVYDINDGKLIWSNKTNTTGVFVDDDFVYAASGAGLRVYKQLEDGTLELFAYQVTAYDENGDPVENLVPGGEYTDEDGNEFVADIDFHSCNFVTAYEAGGMKYIYVAFGQSGVRVYKLDPNAPAEDDAE